jgi:hypothetical protein
MTDGVLFMTDGVLVRFPSVGGLEARIRVGETTSGCGS